jgi:hypothetical protein
MPKSQAGTATPSLAATQPEQKVLTRLLWDRKAKGGFPEVKELKRLVRDVIDPGRDLGHVDRDHREKSVPAAAAAAAAPAAKAVAAEEKGQVASGIQPADQQPAEGQRSRVPLEAQLRAEVLSGAGDASGFPGGAGAEAEMLQATEKQSSSAVPGMRSEVCEDCT